MLLRLTGVVADPAGAVVANAALALRLQPDILKQVYGLNITNAADAPFLRPRSGNPPQGASKTGSLPRIPDHV
jgi:hypothetical protein